VGRRAALAGRVVVSRRSSRIRVRFAKKADPKPWFVEARGEPRYQQKIEA
jgi:hypothetical protein